MSRRSARQETSAGGVVFRITESGTLYLLIRDSYSNWGFPKGHLEGEEQPQEAAVREVREETGLADVELRGLIRTIDWYFRFRGNLIHKVCHFYLMEATSSSTVPQTSEGITECIWVPYESAATTISYANARAVLERAQEMVAATSSRA